MKGKLSLIAIILSGLGPLSIDSVRDAEAGYKIAHNGSLPKSLAAHVSSVKNPHAPSSSIRGKSSRTRTGTSLIKSEAKPRLFKRGLTRNSLRLYSRKGQKLEARYSPKGYMLYDLTAGANVPAADGLYKLQGGGQIRVTKGLLIWADGIAVKRSSIAGIIAPIP